MLKQIYHRYRLFCYKLYGRKTDGFLPMGTECCVLGMEDTLHNGDIVHPCVRYIPEEFRGHKWWMVYTPYPGAKSKMENPILCWGKSECSTPPTEWVVEDLVVLEPAVGYNSDPYLLYNKGKLIVFWRENDTERVVKEGYHHATYAKVYEETGCHSVDKPILYSKDFYYDNEVSPAFISRNGGFTAYATHFRFKASWLQFENRTLRKVVGKVLMVLDILGFYSQQKLYGLAIWKGDKVTSKYKHTQTVKWHNRCRLYRPWHLDIFEHEDNVYAIIQSNSVNPDIILAESSDGVNFKLCSTPLLTTIGTGLKGIYKPSACVIDGTFHLFYTAQIPEGAGLNKLFVTSVNFRDMLNKIR